MTRIDRIGVAALILGISGVGCAGLDNPTALADLAPDVDIDVAVTRVETFEEVEIHVQVREGGTRLPMLRSYLEIEHEAGGAVQVVELQPEGEGYAAHVMFYEPGEHHIHFFGMPQRHRLSREMGDREIDVFRSHQIVGPYWVELELTPAPVSEGEPAHVHLMIFDLLFDGTPGTPAAGLNVEVEVHDLDGGEAPLIVEEETLGEYEVQYEFGEAGIYELHVEIGGDGGEFHIPVIDPNADEENEDGGEGGGHGHGD